MINLSDIPKNRQGVRNLDLIKRLAVKPKPCPPHTPSKWKKEFVYPNAAFDDWETDGTIEVRRCLYCDTKLYERNRKEE